MHIFLFYSVTVALSSRIYFVAFGEVVFVAEDGDVLAYEAVCDSSSAVYVGALHYDGVSVISSSPGRLDLLDGVEDLVVGDVYADQSPFQIILTVQLRGGEEG